MTRIVGIGGGPGGYEAALVAAHLGAEVVVVDRDGLGGASALADCVPSKTLIATAEAMSTLGSSHEELGKAVGRTAVPRTRADHRPGVDLTAVNQRVKRLALAPASSAAAW